MMHGEFIHGNSRPRKRVFKITFWESVGSSDSGCIDVKLVRSSSLSYSKLLEVMRALIE